MHSSLFLLLATAAAGWSASAGQPVDPTGTVAGVTEQPVSDTSSGVTAFVDVNVVPMDHEGVLSDQTVVVKGGRVVLLGPARQVQVPAGAVRIDGRGKFLLPGLADMHAHLFLGTHIATRRSNAGVSEVSAPWADSAAGEQRLFLWLANGVVTIRNLDYVGDESGNSDRNGRLALQFRARAATGQEWLPHMYTAGQVAPVQYLMGVSDGPAPVADSVAAYVAAYKAAGYDFIKIHDEPPLILDSMLAAAKRVGMPVVGHVPPPVRVEHILQGYTSIEHPLTEYLWGHRTEETPTDTTGLARLAAAMHGAGVWNCPTQSHYDRLHYDLLEERRPPYLAVLSAAGVKLLLGTDESPWLGGVTRELQAMVANGLTPYQALLTGTRNVAEYFGTLSTSGTIAAGKRADLVLLTGNPLQDVRYTAQPAGVMLGGRWLSHEAIDQRIAHLTLPMPQADEPVHSYWYNVTTEWVASTTPLLQGIEWTQPQRQQLHTLQALHERQRTALVDSLGESSDYVASTGRVLRLIRQQLDDDRAVMTPDQRATFDPKVTRWSSARHS